ncbi:hypothetical protein CY0110_31695 [Crocosphaera chwakensis CCY0110]|uniref:Uncharacterized protein n=1 Tax=Crocosphaera chwakensis CCY0110 TaxID=391612 RepID=A3IWH5_9CHRO|nr:hypothetical protein CY0110_31695 [Crocosphaera chwakensis CCY0110]
MCEDRFTFNVSKRELATLLASLELFRKERAKEDFRPFSEHFEEIEPLTVKEVDKLTEYLEN